MDVAQTADHALKVLLLIEATADRSVVELSRELQVSRSATQRAVDTLHRRALLTRRRDGRYELGPGLIALARGLPHELARLAEPALRTLASELEEMVVLAVPEGDEAVIIARHNGSHAPLRIDYPIGTRHSLAEGAAGLAILAFLGESVAQRLLPLRDEQLAEIRAEGVVRTGDEPGGFLSALAVPVFAGDTIVGSLGVIVPSARAHRLERSTSAIASAAGRLGRVYESGGSEEPSIPSAGTM